ncbi:flagellar type III secretion system pore protein FliP [Nocardioides sp. REDSEA-S30_B4]|jgi:flagellar biosynthetic protein FliP|uniref:flagellar type III secretion system pore protein FliP n=1 Tax=Nocardioides sp. REDSEA-S30_B4 TaxID=1811552 RepID=UPI000AAEC0AD|nr:flagellar type III secretion system pore protein FliP [Nocardioides sp. REDSEA-S30_B4]
MTSSRTVRRHPGSPSTLVRALVVSLLAPLALLLVTVGTTGQAAAAPGLATAQAQAQVQVQAQVQAAPQPTAPDAEQTQGGNGRNRGNQGADETGADSVVIDVEGLTDKPSSSVTLLLTLTLLSLAPAILLTCTSFTKILVVLGLTRNALGLQQTPPNQVLAGLALFLSVFIMAPVLSQVNDEGLQPYLDGQKNAAAAYESGVEPLREFMLDQTGDEELALLTNVARRDLPANRAEVPMSTLVPAFIISELKQAFIIGFIIFIPFLVIDIVVSGALMALGMMMMPPVMVSLPFKLLLFVLVDGWALIITSLVQSYA